MEGRLCMTKRMENPTDFRIISRLLLKGHLSIPDLALNHEDERHR
jgi:hypothetical protein